MSGPAARAVSALRQLAEQRFPDAVLPMDLFDAFGTSAGFGIANAGGVVLAQADATDNDWPWVYVSGGLAVDVPDVTGAVLWANDRNRHTSSGKFYCAVNQQQDMAAVIYEHALWGGHFRTLLDGPHGPGTFAALGGLIVGLLKDAVKCAADEGDLVLKQFGGRRFPPDQDGLTSLFVITSG